MGKKRKIPGGAPLPPPAPRSLDAEVIAAVERADAPGLRRLLDAGASPNAQRRGPRDCRSSALHLAAASGNRELVTLLADRGADIDAVAFYEDGFDRQVIEGSYTPLFGAIRAGHTEVVRLLLARGASRRFTDSACGETPLITAARLGHVAMIDALVAGSALDRSELERALSEARLARQPAAVARLEQLLPLSV